MLSTLKCDLIFSLKSPVLTIHLSYHTILFSLSFFFFFILIMKSINQKKIEIRYKNNFLKVYVHSFNFMLQNRDWY